MRKGKKNAASREKKVGKNKTDHARPLPLGKSEKNVSSKSEQARENEGNRCQNACSSAQTH